MAKSRKPSSRRRTAAPAPAAPRRRAPVGVVGLGASAGGLAALEELLAHLPGDSGLAFVVVTHQDPARASLLPELLARKSPLPVVEAAHRTPLEPDRVYVAPPGSSVGLLGGTIQLVPSSASGHLPIDFFLRSLASELGPAAIGVVLSGTGTDGTLGLEAIQGAAGFTMAQEPTSAGHAGMPESAIRASAADWVGAPKAIAERLAALARGPGFPSPARSSGAPGLRDAVGRICVLLRIRSGHDFSQYKPSTLERRLERRMAVHQLSDPAAYVRLLQERPAELDLLFRELLIGVTSFFRDAEAFAALGREAVADIVERRAGEQPIRVWVPGCSSGEEAYSIAILFREAIEQRDGPRTPVQIFATDLDPRAIQVARAGSYPDGISADVAPERLKRFFERHDSGYRVRRDLRELVVFSVHNLVQDPPFTHLDLVSCRNLLIYLDAELQARVLPILHYALKPGGWLFLGPSEGVGRFGELFTAVDRPHRLYTRRGTDQRPYRALVPAARNIAVEKPAWAGGAGRGSGPSIAELSQRLLLERFVPPSVIVSDRGEVVYYLHAGTGAFLEPPQGRPTHQLLQLAREGLRLELSAALRQAAHQEAEVVRPGLTVREGKERSLIDLRVQRIADPEALRGLFLVSFETARTPPPPPEAGRRARRGPPRVASLERELAEAHRTLDATVEELETANEELKSTNEELQSTNEELQSTNEELETAKEEAQSVNEELQAVNAQLQAKLDDLAVVNDDLANLLNGTEIATLFLDGDLRIKRFTPSTRAVVRVIESDVGRPLVDLTSELDYATIVDDAREVLRTLVPKRVEVRSRSGAWFLVRILPYRTADNRIEGLVLTFFDVTLTREALALEDAIVQTIREGLVVLDGALRVVLANPAFCRMFRVGAGDVQGRLIYEIDGGAWDIPRLRELLEAVLPRDRAFEGFEVDHTFARLGRRALVLNARRLDAGAGAPDRILLAIEDATRAQGEGSAR